MSRLASNQVRKRRPTSRTDNLEKESLAVFRKTAFLIHPNIEGSKRNLRSRNLLLAATMAVGALTLLYFSRGVSAANVTWDGGGATNNWSDAANWSGDTVPGSIDIVIFDGPSTKDATIDVSVNVRGMQINSGYTGTITQSGSSTITVGDFG